MSQDQATKPRPVCSIEGCERPFYARGWCTKHYNRWRVNGDPEALHERYTPKLCSADDCDRPVKARGLCEMHYQRFKKHGDLLNHHKQAPECSVDGCTAKPYGHGYCTKHYTRWKRTGDPETETFWEKKKAIREAGCSANGCSEPVWYGGLCSAHYYYENRREWRKEYHGRTYERVGIRYAPLDEKIPQLIDKNGPWPRWKLGMGRCWTWTGFRNETGYGRIKTPENKSGTLAHRLVYEMFVGPIPDGLQIDHLCGGGALGCVNPEHAEPVRKEVNSSRRHICARCVFFQSCPDCGFDLSAIGLVAPALPYLKPPKRRFLSAEEVFNEYAGTTGPWSELMGSECRDWNGARTLGYGQFSVKGSIYKVHRYALQRTGIEIPKGYCCDHRCRRPICHEVTHLEVVTIGENSRRGRFCPRCPCLKSCPGCGLDIAGCVNADRWQDESAA